MSKLENHEVVAWDYMHFATTASVRLLAYTLALSCPSTRSMPLILLGSPLETIWDTGHSTLKTACHLSSTLRTRSGRVQHDTSITAFAGRTASSCAFHLVAHSEACVPKPRLREPLFLLPFTVELPSSARCHRASSLGRRSPSPKARRSLQTVPHGASNLAPDAHQPPRICCSCTCMPASLSLPYIHCTIM